MRLILRVDSTSSEHVCAGGEILQNNPKAASMTLPIWLKSPQHLIGKEWVSTVASFCAFEGIFVPRDLIRTGSGWRCASQIQPSENFKPFCWKQYLAHPWQIGKELKTEASVCNYIKSNGRILPLVTILQFSHRKNSIHSEFAKIFFYRTMLEKSLKLSKYDERLVVSIFSYQRHVQLVQKSSS